ncbi:hypothetical protein pipiens_002565 [Culex pipiens pipiens]|uniref:LIM interaction domain-containing protein n=1 Tax=Culex pipiens pipiens TaxID=38569 RepID=A0ABD1DCJ7_CULPP
MTITGSIKQNADEPEPINNFMSFGHMNIEDFMMPGMDHQNNGGPSGNNYQPASSAGPASGSTTPHYQQSPAPSGTSTPGLGPSQNMGTPYSPANVSANSPRPINSPMVMPPPSPSANGMSQSRPDSTNSAMGVPPASPYGQPVPSPQMQQQQQHQSTGAPHMTPPSNPMAAMRLPPLTPPISQPMGVPNITPPVSKMVPLSVPNRTPPVHQGPMMMMDPIITPPMKRTPMMGLPNRFPPMAGDPRMNLPLKQPPMIRGNGPVNPMAQPRPHFTKNPAYKIYELNRRLQDRSGQSESGWWDYFVCEFFEDNASLTLSLCLDDGPKHFTIGRSLIPRFFRSFYEGGAVELYFNLRTSKEWLQNSSIMVDSEQCAMETLYMSPVYTKVVCEGRLTLEFGANEMLRIKSWNFTARGWQEHIPRSFLSMQVQQQSPSMMAQLSTNITRQGFPQTTLNYLRLCCILQPMQQLMIMHKATSVSPRECLNAAIERKWPVKQEQEPPTPPVIPQEPTRPAPKQRKKRKNAADKETTTNSRKKRSPEPPIPAPVIPLPLPVVDQAEVMVVGEPSLMGGGLGKDDERLITRVENMPFPMGNGSHMGNGHGHHSQSGPSGAGPGDTSWSLEDVLGASLSDLDEHLRRDGGNVDVKVD